MSADGGLRDSGLASQQVLPLRRVTTIRLQRSTPDARDLLLPVDEGGSGTPARIPAFALLAQSVEHLHGKEGVDGSSPSEGLGVRAFAGGQAGGDAFRCMSDGR